MTLKNIRFAITLFAFAVSACTSTSLTRMNQAKENWSQKYDVLHVAYQKKLVSTEQYWNAYWNLTDSLAEDSGFMDFNEYAAYGRMQTQRFFRGETTQEEFSYLITARANSTVEVVNSKLKQEVDREAAQRTQNAFMFGAVIGTLFSPPTQPSYCSGTVSGNAFSGNCW